MYRMIGEFKNRYNLLVILGPTASGKTRLAVKMAAMLGGEIISADSRQVYRGMDLGTGKDLSSYIHNGKPIPFHLIDIIEPHKEFSLFDFQLLFRTAFMQISGRRNYPILCGGTGLYIDSVVRRYRMLKVPHNQILREELADLDTNFLRSHLTGISKKLHNTTDLLERERLIRAIEIRYFKNSEKISPGPLLQINPFIIGIYMERKVLRAAIRRRLEERIEKGMIEEVRNLLQCGLDWKRLEALGLEYRYVSRFLRGMIDKNELITVLHAKIGQYAKRQETWYRGMERNGISIHWIEGPDEKAALNLMRSVVNSGHQIF